MSAAAVVVLLVAFCLMTWGWLSMMDWVATHVERLLERWAQRRRADAEREP